jgi:hypothetical protein
MYPITSFALLKPVRNKKTKLMYLKKISKRLILLSTFIMTSFILFSFLIKKNNTTNQSQKSSTTRGSVIKSDAPASISNDEMNILYIGVKNPVTIAVPGFDSKDLIIYASETLEIINDNEPGRYIVTANQVTPKGNEACISVYAKSGLDTVQLGDHFFRCRRFPDPIFALESYENGQSIKKENLNYLKNIYAQKPIGFDYDASYQIQDWEISIIKKENLIVTIKGKGSKLSTEAQSSLAKLSEGDNIILDASALAADKSIRRFSMKLTIE